MAMTFDAALKELVKQYPPDFLATFYPCPRESISLLNVDLSTVTTSSDFVIGLGEPPEEILHIEFQASASADKHLDVFVYNALLHREHGVPVHTIVILLRRQAGHSNLNGTVAYTSALADGSMNFRYEIVRLWERPAHEFLAGNLGMTPLAVLGHLPPELPIHEALESIIQQMADRVMNEATPDKAEKLLVSAFLLSGLRVDRTLVRELFEGVQAVKESETYLMILDEGKDIGRVEEARETVLRLGSKRFGEPTLQTQTAIKNIEQTERLHQLQEKIFDVQTWDELLAGN
ncbi:MAG: hypothetical protein ACFCD0_00840 [Gemmataceae bacterium]